MKKWLIGIDEAGRGPLAGPVSVGVVLVPRNFDWDLIPGVGDSKKVSEKNREQIFRRTKELQTAGQLNYKVVLVSAKIIDTKGVVFAINSALKSGLTALSKSPIAITPSSRSCLELGEVLVLLDGGLRAPVEFMHQETIIKGDSLEKVIGLASIMAKVTRDRYMVRLAGTAEYQHYDFAQHKGYGTKAHRKAIATYGLSTLHRVSYCKNIRPLYNTKMPKLGINK